MIRSCQATLSWWGKTTSFFFPFFLFGVRYDCPQRETRTTAIKEKPVAADAKGLKFSSTAGVGNDFLRQKKEVKVSSGGPSRGSDSLLAHAPQS
jgi:hypothetical protein